jgi:hemin uptake protein HemP
MRTTMHREHRTDRHNRRREPEIAPDGVIDTGHLFGDRDVIEIHHNGEVYRLRITKSGKLILTK